MKTPPEIPSWDLWSLAWARAHRLRRRWYRTRSRSLPRPVVSVGNLHWGGTGKSPIVAAIARHLRHQGKNPCILSRGYGRNGRGPTIVSQGDGPLVGVDDAGDEPFQHASDLDGVSIVVAEQRYRGGQLALEVLDPSPDLFLLDDGFSHLALQRDLDLLVLPSGDPWGGGRLPPGGRLREPLASSQWAHAVLWAGPDVDSASARRIPELLAPWGFVGEAFAVPTTTGRVLDPDGAPIDRETPLLLVTGIARSHRVLEAARAEGLTIAEHLEFPDHHRYPAASLHRIEATARAREVAAVLTTAKDRGKLRGRLDRPLLVLPLEAQIEDGFYAWLDRRLAEWAPGAADRLSS